MGGAFQRTALLNKKCMVHLTIYFNTSDAEIIDKIRKRFNIPPGMTVNGETESDIKEEDMPLLEETARRGFIKIRYKAK